MNDTKLDELDLKGIKGSNNENQEDKIRKQKELLNKIRNEQDEAMEKVKFNRISKKILLLLESPILIKLSWQDEIKDLCKRIIPGKAFNLWEESIEKEYFQRPKFQHLPDLIHYLENKKIKVLFKTKKGSKRVEINELDFIDFLDRDFLFVGEIEKGLVKRDKYEWYSESSLTLPNTDVFLMNDMITVINNKIFYVEKIVWELDNYIQFTKNIDYNITVYDIDII